MCPFDVSDVAIRKARTKAKKEGVKVKFRRIEAEKFSFGVCEYDLILNFYFLDRGLFPKIRRALKRGGVLIFETYNEDYLDVNPEFKREYLLSRGELLREFIGMDVLYYSEVSNITTLVVKKP